MAMPPLDRSTIWPYEDGEPGEYHYSRFGHPTQSAAERELGELEGGRALLFASGSGASTAVVLAFLRPGATIALEQGADHVLHSATKFLTGHHDAVLGAVVCRDDGDAQRLEDLRGRTGIIAAPESAWLLQRGLSTLEVRMRRHTESAVTIAERLAAHEAVERVRYPGFGGLLSFDVAGGARATPKVETGTRTILNATSLGGARSTLETRRRWDGERVPDNLVRLSVGLEPLEVLWNDLNRALCR